MIRPAPRLLMWFGLAAVPLSAVAGVDRALAPACLAGLAAFAALAVLDAVRSGRALRGMAASLPPVVRLTRGRPGLLPVGIHRSAALPEQVVRLTLGLPGSVESVADAVPVRLPAGARLCTANWPCTARRRGRVSISTACVEAVSPLGFWEVSRVLPLACELRCFPDLAPERRRLAGLFLNREGLGVHPRRQVGQGREFEKLRDYQPGDSFEDIHWRATAKRGRPITREYQIEKTQELYVILDASRLSARPAGEPGPGSPAPAGAVLDVYLRAALVLALVARRQGDRFGLAAFSDRVLAFVRASGGRGHFGACRDALYRLEAAPVSPDFDEAAAFLRTRVRRRALLVFLTSLDDPVLAEGFLRGVGLLSPPHVVVAAMLQPAGAEPLLRRPVAEDAGVWDALAGHLAWDTLRHIGLQLRRRGVVFRTLTHDALCADLVSQYLAVKQRQIL